MRVAIETSYDMAAKLAGQEDIKRQAGVRDLADLRDRPLEECDRLANKSARTRSSWRPSRGRRRRRRRPDHADRRAVALRPVAEDDPPNRPLLRISRSMIARAGITSWACWPPRFPGHSRPGGTGFDRLRELEDLLIEETQEEILAEEVTSFLFQLEIFEEVPGVGAISGGLLNLAFLRRVDVTARRVFQERWLRDNGKLEAIAPAPVHARHLATGWSGALGRAVYSGCYYLGFGVAIPVCIAAELIRPMDNPLTRGSGTAPPRPSRKSSDCSLGTGAQRRRRLPTGKRSRPWRPHDGFRNGPHRHKS